MLGNLETTCQASHVIRCQAQKADISVGNPFSSLSNQVPPPISRVTTYLSLLPIYEKYIVGELMLSVYFTHRVHYLAG